MHLAKNCVVCCSSTDTLKGAEKFFCNECGCLQEAQKRTKVKELPQVLFLHLNRFKYTTHMDRWAAGNPASAFFSLRTFICCWRPGWRFGTCTSERRCEVAVVVDPAAAWALGVEVHNLFKA